jgi:hypothetical protein
MDQKRYQLGIPKKDVDRPKAMGRQVIENMRPER